VLPVTTTQTIDDRPPVGRARTAAYLLRLLAGPLAFAAVMLAPLALSYEGRVALATFACAIVWWMTEPMPWALAAMTPFLVFPAAGVMDIGATMALYGQPIFFWIMGTVLMGYAIEKHGLAQRFALGLLALPGIGGRTGRLTFTYMVIVGAISMFVSDAATIAMTIPIGMSLVRHAQTLAGAETARSRFAAFITLGTLYASVAGGTATIMGVPHNAISVSLLEQFTGRQLGFFEWMRVGLPVFVALLVAFYAVLWALVRPEIRDIPSGEAFLQAERAKLGSTRPNERRVMLVFALMVTLFTLPTLVGLVFGGSHEAARWLTRALPVWVVPIAVMFLLFTIRSSEDDGALVTWRDAEQHGPWNTMFLVGGAVAMTDALTKFGFAELVGGAVSGLGLGSTALPYLAATVVAVATNFISGTALYCSIFIPAAVQIGFNPASMAILIAHLAVGVIFPWAGATAATAFAAGDVGLVRMIRVGLVSTVVFILVVATIHVLMAGVV
jgi:solute carrier family 13 (sodium-dependent dicarboxylate transporter), member 2/3/5